ncbi:DUF2461 domain-containing protein [Nocardioides sp. SYSU D00038]|uniref:DUF2461 domain-containing protein n=1 Tax=Nocardioides sp. SYSU D00038 TaxID=2812554 RepID=UPI0019683A34|nr:DUF2461 domain-containing protein [Nocardioides sp. SYSU D00038]
MSFDGFPAAALDFYDDLEVDNTRSYWEKHKQVYADAVRAPMTALCAALEPEFGTAKIFRPHRDVRFSKDKTPYKTHQGAFVAVGPATGFYVEVSPRGVRTGAGFYEAAGPRLAAFRSAVAHDTYGPQLEKVLTSLQRKGFEVGGDRLKTSPRGYDADHPRIELLRHRSLVVGHQLGFEPVIHTPGLLDLVRKDWRALRPLVAWVAEHAEPRVER